MAVVVASLAVAAAVFVGLAYRRRWRWTGFTEERGLQRDSDAVGAGKTLWDWMQLLVIPLGLAGAAFVLNSLQSDREQSREDARAQRERAIARDGRREADLRLYIAQMSDLLLHQKLGASREGSPVQKVARTLTLTVLPRLDGTRKGQVLQFLNEAEVIKNESTTIVSLEAADLRGAAVPGRLFEQPNLQFADLRGADFRGANLPDASFSGSDLRGADFRGTTIENAEFDFVDLRDANFRGATLDEPLFNVACLSRAKFVGATLWGAKFRDTFGERVDFSRADLADADLLGLYLRQPRLEGAKRPKGWPTQSTLSGKPGSTPDVKPGTPRCTQVR